MKTKAEEFNKLACQLGYDTGESLVDAMKKNDRIEKHAGYCQVIEMTKEEKVAMYMKLTKKELIEMLLQNQELLEQRINSDISPRWYTTCVSGTTINSSGVGTKKIKL